VVTLICIDVDGTLVGTAGRIAARVWPAVDAVARAGIHVALCSGRPAFGFTRKYAERVAPDGWHVFQNGASIARVSTNESRSAALSPESVQDLTARARRTGRILELYGDHTYVVESSSERAARHAEFLGVPFAPRSLDTVDWPVVRAQWLVPLDEIAAVMNEPHDGFEVAPSTSPLMPDTNFVNLTPAGVDKASGLRVLAEIYGCSLADVMYVGDGLNDLSAMRLVGFPVAMGNAAAEVKRAARYHVGDVDAGSVADALALAMGQRY
jgi:Cof subfamily protein (haloacid dehalogenase superfamily)